jgi:hypothetical protein
MELAARRLEDRMRGLAQRDDVGVLEYVYDEQTRGADAVNAVKLAELVAERRLALGASCSDEEAGRRLRREDPLLRDFARDFPVIFRKALDREGAPRHLAMLKQLARIRKEVEGRHMGEAEANVHATRVILEKTMRAPTEEERSTLTPQQ